MYFVGRKSKHQPTEEARGSPGGSCLSKEKVPPARKNDPVAPREQKLRSGEPGEKNQMPIESSISMAYLSKTQASTKACFAHGARPPSIAPFPLGMRMCFACTLMKVEREVGWGEQEEKRGRNIGKVISGLHIKKDKENFTCDSPCPSHTHTHSQGWCDN